MTTSPWPIEVLAVGAASAGAVAYRRGGKLHLSAIVKATFAFTPSGVMAPAFPTPLRLVEAPSSEGDPLSSAREAVDTAPALQRADVIFAGHAYAPAATPAPRVMARLAVRATNGRALVDKSLEVLGDRLFMPSRPPPEPKPFTKMPVIYERAYGGPDYGTNPVGMGQIAELSGRRRLPNIVHPERSARPPVEPAGFAPISARWPVRRRMLRGPAEQLLSLPIREIPDSLDPAYFQAAPADQQTMFLQGDEWIVLEGLHPVHATLETQLPGARGAARVYLPDGSYTDLSLVADTLFIDGDAEQCAVTWRGSFPIPSEADLRVTSVVAGVELPGRPVPLPDRAQLPARPPPLPGRQPARPPPLPGRQRTEVVSPPEEDIVAQLAAVAARAPSVRLDGTMVLNDGDAPPPAPPPLPGRQKTTVLGLAPPPRPPEPTHPLNNPFDKKP